MPVGSKRKNRQNTPQPRKVCTERLDSMYIGSERNTTQKKTRKNAKKSRTECIVRLYNDAYDTGWRTERMDGNNGRKEWTHKMDTKNGRKEWTKRVDGKGGRK